VVSIVRATRSARFTGYSATKAALRSFVRTWTAEFAGRGIRANLISPGAILLTRAALPELRRCGDGLIVNIAATGAFVGRPFYAPYVAAKAGLVRFTEAMRRELMGQGVHVLSVIPGPTDTPMISTVKASAVLGAAPESPADVAAAIVEGMTSRQIEVFRGGEAARQMVALNQQQPTVLDERFLALRPALQEAVRDHIAL
jgi:uncharacterized oxidoreductase